MKIPTFAKTIRFKLTLWYLAFSVLFAILLIGGINLAMMQFMDEVPPRLQDGVPPWKEIDEPWESSELGRLRHYSLLSLGGVLLFGAAGGYFLSGRC